MVNNYHQYCSECGKVVIPDEIIYPDMLGWAKEYDKAKREGGPMPEPPGAAKTVCCGARPIYPPAPALEIPPLPYNTRRVETMDFSALIRLCNAIGKSPNAIWAYLRLDRIPSLFGPKVFFIDVKADYMKERIDQFLIDEQQKELE